MFRKAPSMNSTRRFMPRDCCIRWNSVVHTHIFYLSRPMVKSVSKECHGSRDMRTGNGGSSLCVVAELAWWFMTRSSGIESRCNNTGEFQIPTLQDENPRSGLSWLCLAIALLKTLFFVSENFLQDESLRSMIGWQWRLCTVSFLKASLL
jgi:hypothetical protein